jgi:hypothetical protein
VIKSPQQEAAMADAKTPSPPPIDDLVAPFLLGPFRLLDKLFSGGRVTAAFHLDQDAKRPDPQPAR